MANRKHHKIDDLPDEIRAEVSKLLAPPNNYTYTEVASHLAQMGVNVGKSSVHRWHTDFAKAAERIKQVREQVAGIVNELRTNPSTELAQVASDMLLTGALEAMAKGVDFEGKDPIKMGFMVADLTRAEVSREKLKMAFREKAEAATKGIEEKVEKLTKKKLDPETMRIIREEIYGLGPG